MCQVELSHVTADTTHHTATVPAMGVVTTAYYLFDIRCIQGGAGIIMIEFTTGGTHCHRGGDSTIKRSIGVTVESLVDLISI